MAYKGGLMAALLNQIGVVFPFFSPGKMISANPMEVLEIPQKLRWVLQALEIFRSVVKTTTPWKEEKPRKKKQRNTNRPFFFKGFRPSFIAGEHLGGDLQLP